MKNILSVFLITTSITTQAFAQSSERINNNLPLEVIATIKDKSLTHEEFKDALKKVLEEYPEQYLKIGNIVATYRPSGVQEYNRIISESDIDYRSDNLRKDRYSNLPNNQKNNVKPNTVVGQSNNLGLIAAGVGGLALAAAALSSSSDSNTNNTTGGGNGGDNGGDNGQDPGDFVTPEFQFDYSLGLLGVQDFYATEGASGQGVVVGIVDSGVDMSHPDLINNMDTEKSFSYRSNDSNVQDLGGHGTHVAGIIGAMKNDQGRHGIAYNSSLIAYEAIEIDTPPAFSDVITRATEDGVQVLNNSWSYLDESSERSFLISDFNDSESYLNHIGGEATANALQLAVEQNDMVFVFASGNDGQNDVSSMAGLPVYVPDALGNWVAVGAVDQNKEIAGFSNRCGSAADWCLVAPGVGINSTFSRDADPNQPNFVVNEQGDYAITQGTSMATPFVAGAISLGMEVFPEQTAQQVLQVLFDTAEDLGESGVDNVYGQGLLNLGESLAPQGALSVHMTDNVLSNKKYNALNSGFVGSSILSNSLVDSLEDVSMIVTDKYDRGFKTSLSSFMGSSINNRKFESDVSLEKFIKNQKKNVMKNGNVSFYLDDNLYSSNPEAGFSINNNLFSTSILLNSDEQLNYLGNDNFVNANSFGVHHLGLIENNNYAMKNEFNLSDSFKIRTSFSSGDSIPLEEVNSDVTAMTFGLGLDISSNNSVGVDFGQVEESGSILGSFGFGAFHTDKTNTETEFVNLNGKIGLSRNTSFLLSGSMGESKFKQNGLIKSGNMETSSYAIGINRKNIISDSDSFSLAISRPLQVSGGKVNVNLPFKRTPSKDGAVSTGIIRENKDISIDNPNSYDLQFGYNKMIGNNDNQNLSLGGLISNFGNKEQTFNLAANLIFKF